MPRDSAGNYSLVAGNPVQSGEVVSSSWANNTLDDVAVALSDSLDRNGRGGMLAPFRFSDGTNLLPGAAWVNETTTGFYRFDGGDLRIAVLTQDVMRWQTSGAQVWDTKRSQWVGLLDAGGATTIDINQVGHGFALLDCVQFDGTWVKAQADADNTLALGVVVEVIDADNFTYAMSGRFEVANALTTDSWYYLSDSVAGELTATEPPISQPIVYVESSSHISIYPYRPFEADPYADLPTVGTEGQTLRWEDTLPGWEATSSLVVTDAGNVGIGTAAPAYPLEVVGTVKGDNFEFGTKQSLLYQVSNDSVGFRLGSDVTTFRYPSFIAQADSSVLLTQVAGSLALGANNTEHMRITSTGNVGIGTTAPTAKLDVAVTSGNPEMRLSGPNTFSQLLHGDAAGNLIISADEGNAAANSRISFEVDSSEKMRIDDAGNVGIGTTAPTNKLAVSSAVGNAGMSISAETTGSSELIQSGGDSVARHVLAAGGFSPYVNSFDIQQQVTGAATFQLRANSYMQWLTNNIERMRIDASGNVLVGTTTTPTAGSGGFAFIPTSDSRVVASWSSNSTANGTHCTFSNPNGTVGSIQTSGSATAYNTASDYRLKENNAPIVDALTRVGQLLPYRFNFKADPYTTVDGFFAHEVTPVCPEAISGEKDGEEMQGIDQSKLVPLLVAAIQELHAEVEALKNV